MTDKSDITDEQKLETIKNHVRSYPNYPTPGVTFRDIFSVLQDPAVFALLEEQLIKKVKTIQPPVECVVGLDSRGFLFAPLIALKLNIPFVPIRKKGKLPGKVRRFKYTLEYGQDEVEIPEEAIREGAKVLIVDDLLATGGTLKAACNLVSEIGGNIVKCLVVMELIDLKGRDRLPVDVISLIEY